MREPLERAAVAGRERDVEGVEEQVTPPGDLRVILDGVDDAAQEIGDADRLAEPLRERQDREREGARDPREHREAERLVAARLRGLDRSRIVRLGNDR